VGAAWGTPSRVVTRHSPDTPVLFPRFSRACDSFSVIPHTSLTRFLVPLPACLLPLRARAPHPCSVLNICLRNEMSAPLPAEAGPPLPAVLVRPLLDSLFRVVRCRSSVSGGRR
jgi:hypothetical protein